MACFDGMFTAIGDVFGCFDGPLASAYRRKRCAYDSCTTGVAVFAGSSAVGVALSIVHPPVIPAATAVHFGAIPVVGTVVTHIKVAALSVASTSFAASGIIVLKRVWCRRARLNVVFEQGSQIEVTSPSRFRQLFRAILAKSTKPASQPKILELPHHKVIRDMGYTPVPGNSAMYYSHREDGELFYAYLASHQPQSSPFSNAIVTMEIIRDSTLISGVGKDIAALRAEKVAPEKNEAMSMVPIGLTIKPHGPPFFTVWAPRPTHDCALDSNGKYQGPRPGDVPMTAHHYYALVLGQRLKCTEPGAPTVEHDFLNTHSYNEMTQKININLCVVTIGFDFDLAMPYTQLSRQWPQVLGTLIDAKPHLQKQLVAGGDVLPSVHHLQDLLVVSWPFSWNHFQVAGQSMKQVKYKVCKSDLLRASMPSVDNNTMQYQWSRDIMCEYNTAHLNATGEAWHSGECSGGNSSTCLWSENANEYLLVGVHHAGVEKQPGCRNIMTPGRVCLQALKRSCGLNSAPTYAQAFERNCDDLINNVWSLIDKAEEASKEFGAEISINLPDRLSSAVSETFSPFLSLLPAAARYEASDADLKKVYNRVVAQVRSNAGKHFKGHSKGYMKALLYNAGLGENAIGEFDEHVHQAAEWALQQHLDMLGDDGWNDFADYMYRHRNDSISVVDGVLTIRELDSAPQPTPQVAAVHSTAPPPPAATLRARSRTRRPIPADDEVTPHNMVFVPTAKLKSARENPNRYFQESYDTRCDESQSFKIPRPPLGARGALHDSVLPDVAAELLTNTLDNAKDLAPHKRARLEAAIGEGTCPFALSRDDNNFLDVKPFLCFAAAPPGLSLPDQQLLPRVVAPTTCVAEFAFKQPAEALDMLFAPEIAPEFNLDVTHPWRDFPEHVNPAAPDHLPDAPAEDVNKVMKVFGHLLSQVTDCDARISLDDMFSMLEPVANSLKGTCENHPVFKSVVGNRLHFDAKDSYVQKDSPIDSAHTRFLGLATSVGKQSKDFQFAPKTGWFDTWDHLLWNDKTDRPRGALAASGPKAIRRSLNAQFSRRLTRKIQYAKPHFDMYSQGFPAPAWSGHTSVRKYLKTVFKSLNSEKTPAWDKQKNAATKIAWTADDDNLAYILLRIVLTVATDFSTAVDARPLALMHAGLLSPEQLFTKDEIHYENKVDSERARIIWNTSVSDEVVMRFFHDVQNKLEIDLFQDGQTHSPHFPTFGSCCGMGHHDEGHVQTVNAIRKMLGSDEQSLAQYQNGTSLDASGWDMSVSFFLWMLDARRRASAACAGGARYAYVCGVMMLGVLASSHIIQVGSEVHEVLVRGIMGSGRSSTSSSNSFMRGLLHSDANFAFALSQGEPGAVGLSCNMGDDNVGKDKITDFHKAHWASLGCIIDEKGDVISLEEPVPFTSHLYNMSDKTAVYNNGKKLLLRLAYMNYEGKKLTCEQACGIRFAVRNSEFAPLIDDFIRADSRTASFLGVDIDDPTTKFDLVGFC